MKYLILFLWPISAAADFITPTRVLPAGTIITASDVTLHKSDQSGFLDFEGLIGQEAMVMLIPERPISPEQVMAPAIIDRNDLITLIYDHGGLRIQTEGRALSRGAKGETIRAMNLSSRSIISGKVTQTGTLEVVE